MKVRYFADTDTLYIELNDHPVVDTRDLDDDTLLEFDEQGQLSAITVEHASRKGDVKHLTVEGIAAWISAIRRVLKPCRDTR